MLAGALAEPNATFGEGYWCDHWTYSLDLIENLLSVWPEKKRELLFGAADYPWYETKAVVLPHAQLKVFLTATAEERARRRFMELQERGTPQPFEQVLAEMNERDERDTNRAAAPLRAAEDAVMLDTTDMTPDEVLAFLRKLVEERRGE